MVVGGGSGWNQGVEVGPDDDCVVAVGVGADTGVEVAVADGPGVRVGWADRSVHAASTRMVVAATIFHFSNMVVIVQQVSLQAPWHRQH